MLGRGAQLQTWESFWCIWKSIFRSGWTGKSRLLWRAWNARVFDRRVTSGPFRYTLLPVVWIAGRKARTRDSWTEGGVKAHEHL